MRRRAYSLKTLVLSVIGFAGAAAVGVILTPAAPPAPSGPTLAPRASAALEDEVRALRAELQDRAAALAETDLTKLRRAEGDEGEADGAAADAGGAEGGLARLRGRLAALEGAMAERAAADPAAALEEALEAFARAVGERDGHGARAALARLASIQTDAGRREALRAWGELEDIDWLGLSGRQRRGWGSRGFFHWLLRSEPALEPARSQNIQRQALNFLAAMEPDRDRLVETLTLALRRMPPPRALTEDELKRRRRGRGRAPDLYRDAFDRLAESGVEVATLFLEESLADTRLPGDLRVAAVRGLSRINSPAAQGAILTALQDLDPKVAQAAALAADIGRVQSPGVYLLQVDPKGAGAKLGLARGTVIIAADGEPLRSNRDLRRLRRKRGKEVRLEIERGGVRSELRWRVSGDLDVRGQAVSPPRRPGS